MQSKAKNADDYVASLPGDRQKSVAKIREAVNKNLPKGFEERMSYGMIGWVIPHELYPPGYHCDPTLPLGLMGVASQKQYIAVYSMLLYQAKKHLEWFQKEWPKHTAQKLDMGKSCIRFKKVDDIPYELIGKLAARVTPAKWIEICETAIVRR